MAISTPSMQELLTAGVHFGHKISRGHPKMKQFIYGAREGVHIIDLAMADEKLKEAAEEAYKLGKAGKVLLIVGTKKQAKQKIESLAKEANSFYLNKRWVGGLLTNFEEIRKNIKKLNDLKIQQEKGELSRYTKKEQLVISRKLTKFISELGGIADMDKIPDAMFIVDAVSDKTAVVEAKKTGVEVLGLCDTNADPYFFDFPVPANDDGIKSINLICDTVLGAYVKGKKSSSAQATEDKEAGIKEESKESEGTEEPKVKKTGEKAGEKKSEKIEEKTENPEEPAPAVDAAVAHETAALEEEVEKVVLEESERKIE